MLQMKRIMLVAALFAVAACGDDEQTMKVQDADVTVVATELATGNWQVDFVFPEPQSALIFSRSNGDYRTASWVPIENASPVRRVGGFDSLIFETPQTQFSYDITPYTQGIPQDYTPFLAFTDGGTALYTGQFEVLSVADTAEIEALGGNLQAWQGEQPTLSVRIQSDRPMLWQGGKQQDVVEHVSKGSGAYIYVGESKLKESENYIGVIDEALPDHLQDNLDTDLAALFEIFQDRWGFSLPTRVTIYYAFEGYDRAGFSNKGSVIGTDLMVLQSSGDGLREPNPEYRLRNLWFFAHEGAHMFQSKVMGQFAVGPDAWIHEGGANAMANSAIQTLAGVPDSFILGEYQSAFENCVSDLESGSLMTAHSDGRFYAHYNCGQLFNAAADAALADHDLYGFWVAFSERIDPENRDPSAAFFDTLDALGADPQIGATIRTLAYEDCENPRSELSHLLSVSGLEPVFDENGALVSLKVPA